MTIADETGRARTVTRDALGRVTRVVEDPGGLNYTTGYSWDPLGNLIQVSQAAETRTFAYDSLSRLMRATNPESGTVTYGYDNAGNLVARTDARGVQTVYGYDSLNRLATIRYSDGTSPVTYSYDPQVPNGIGQIGSIGNGNSVTNFTGFDAMGRVLSSNQQTAGTTYPFVYTYNLAGLQQRESYPSGRIVCTDYDRASREARVLDFFQGAWKTYLTVQYAPHGEPTQLWYGNDLVLTYLYDNRLRPNWTWDAVHNSASDMVLRMNLAWDANGNLNAATTNHGGPGYPVFQTYTDNYWYDRINRLTNAFGVDANNHPLWAQNFGYDAYGNVWQTGTGGVPAFGNTPTANIFTARNQIGGIRHDAAGNQTLVNGNTAAYDAENRQVSVTEPAAFGGAMATYQYDGSGQRVSKVVGGVTTVYVYDVRGQLVAEYSSGPGTTPLCATCYLTLDHLGNTRLVTDANANVIARHDYTPFGQELPGGWAGRTQEWGVHDGVPVAFTGQVRQRDRARCLPGPLLRLGLAALCFA